MFEPEKLETEQAVDRESENSQTEFSRKRRATDVHLGEGSTGKSLVTYIEKSERIQALKRSNEQIANMREPYIRSWRQLKRHKILNRRSDPRILKIFGEISAMIMRRFSNAVIVVTSAVPRGGNSLVALNLSVALTYYERNTALLVDCHMKRKAGYEFLLPNRRQKGLSDYLASSDVEEKDIVYPVGIPKLRVIPSGASTIRGESYESARMLQLMVNAQHRYPERYIVVDAPPMTESSYYMILSQLADGVVVVVPYGRVTPRNLARLTSGIEEDKFLGFLLNDAAG